MIRGYFSADTDDPRPYVHAVLHFPTIGTGPHEVDLLVDTGADQTVLAPDDAVRFGIDFRTLPMSGLSLGIGGEMEVRSIPAVVTLGTFTIPVSLLLLPPPPEPSALPSLLGRDVMSHFALFMEERTERLLLLEPEETARLQLP